MPIIDVTEIRLFLKPGACIACLDLGTKTIGIAVSDIGLCLANPRPVLKRTKFPKDAAVLLDIFRREKVMVAVIGLPLNMNGSIGPRVQATRAFVRNMLALTTIPFMFHDERLSTIAAERSLIKMNVSRYCRAQRIDSAAAAFILQGVLDHLQLFHKSRRDNIFS